MYWSAGMSEQIEDLARVEAEEVAYLEEPAFELVDDDVDPTHYETECFCVGPCRCGEGECDGLTEDEREAAEAAADAQYDAWKNR